MSKSFNPGVMIDGRRVEVPGFMWIVAFASRGVQWAIDAMEQDPTIEQRFKNGLVMQEIEKVDGQIEYHQRMVSALQGQRSKWQEQLL